MFFHNLETSLFENDWFYPPLHWDDKTVSDSSDTVISIKQYIDARTDDVKHYTKPFDVDIVCHEDKDFSNLEVNSSPLRQLFN